jgi:hypothetical protein
LRALIPTSPHDRPLNLFVRLLTCITCQWFRNRDISKRPVIVATAAADEVIAWAAFTNFKVNGARALVGDIIYPCSCDGVII